jgi:hypothetical protein
MPYDCRVWGSWVKTASEVLSRGMVRRMLVGWRGVDSRCLMEGSGLLRTHATTVVWGRWRRAWVRPSPIPWVVVRMEGN